MKKIFSLLSVILLTVSCQRADAAAREMRDMSPAAGAGAGGSSFASAHAPHVTPELPALDLAAIHAYFGGRFPSTLASTPDLNALELRPLDMYAVVGTALAFEAAKTPEKFKGDRFSGTGVLLEAGTMLTPELLQEMKLPAIFVGWRVVCVKKNMKPATASASSGTVSPTGFSSVLGMDDFDNTYTNIFGLTLEAPTGFKLTCIRGPVPTSLKDLLMNTITVLNGGDPIQAIAQSRTCIQSTYKDARVEDLDRLGFAIIPPETLAADKANVDLMQARRRQWIKESAEDIDLLLRKSNPHAVAADLAAGTLINVILRALEDRLGSAQEMASRIKIFSFNASETDGLVDFMKSLSTGANFATLASPVTGKNYSHTNAVGARMEDFRSFYRRGNIFGEYAKHLGEWFRLPAEPALPENLTAFGAGTAVAAAAGAGAGGGAAAAAPAAGLWSWLPWGTSAVVAPAPVVVAPPPAPAPAATGRFWTFVSSFNPFSTTATATPDTSLVELQRRILRSNGIKGIMDDMAWAYAVNNPLVAPVAAGADAVAPMQDVSIYHTWDEVARVTAGSGTALPPVWRQ